MTKDEMYKSLDKLQLIDERRFRRRLKKARAPKALAAISADLDKALHKPELIDAGIPEITYPDALPVSARKDDIARAIADNQVVIIAGETGSGKTTQIPKICLDLGRGRRGLIGHTQPRRLAARTVAERIAEELGQDIGESVGYAIRFDDRVSESTAVKLMTDGILLAEMQRDRDLLAYDTIIIDEAHERSLNIDFLLGYIHQLLPRRPDLKVIITSATIDPERFAKHFDAPVLEVSGRTYPVEIRYRPLVREQGDKIIDIDPLDGLCDALTELMAEGPGDILCFFPGERDIRDAMEAIEAKKWRGVEVTPLFGRLSNQEQHRVFSPHSGRRIVLSTNIAETSLTVPGIRYVVDTGTARISRYSTRTKVQRLPIEPISQASANQRSGRCGRVAEGVAIRLYSQEDFESRPEFTDPEILRTNLASVILQMMSLRLGDIQDFPFVESPEPKAVRDGLTLLAELGASDGGKLTAIGKDLARIPVDPRMARMLVEADRLGVLDDVTVLVAAMTIQDVRERPLDKQTQADQAHARFKDKASDFVSTLNLFDYIDSMRDDLSGNQFRKRMTSEFLHYMRIREWYDLVRQLRDVTRQIGWSHREKVLNSRDVDSIHQALLAGLLSNIGVREGNSKEFNGARGTKFLIFPGSALAKKPPQFVMAAELVETSRLFARDVAAIEPAWVERAAGSLLRRTYSEPTWSRKRAAAIAHEKVMLYGVTLIADRTVAYHRVDPEAARDLFIRNGLVDGEWNAHHDFLKRNADALERAAEIEEKARRRGIVVDDDALAFFYDKKIPNSVTTGAHFDSWWKKAKRTDPHLLDFDPEELLASDDHSVNEEDFPTTWRNASLSFELTYRFEPGHHDDGVTVHIPVPLLAGVSEEGFDWLVPGMRLELVTELIRSLPKAIRRSVVPAPDFARRALPELKPEGGSLTQQLANVLRGMGASGINAEDFDPSRLPSHLRMNFAAVNRKGKVIDSDKSLAALQRRQAQSISTSMSKAAASSESEAVTTWTAGNLGEISETVQTRVDGQTVTAYPALAATKNGVAVKVLPTKAAAEASMATATLSMLLQDVTVNAKQMVKGLPLQQRVALDNYPHGGVEGLVADARVAATRDAMQAAGGPVRSPEKFQELLATVKADVPGKVRQAIVSVAPAIKAYLTVAGELKKWTGPAIEDMERQLDFLLPQHALTRHGVSRMAHLPRYLKAMEIRLEEMGLDPDKDADRQDEVEQAMSYVRRKLEHLPSGAANSAAVAEVMWMIQELRVSVFAQRLGTSRPVSVRRIMKAMDKVG